MTNKEIEKLLSMLDKKDLSKIREFLLQEQYKNNNKLRQKTFEEYLRANKFGLDVNTTPKLYEDENVQKFSNGVSLYIINKNFFNTKTSILVKGSARGAKANHRFEHVGDEWFSDILSKILLKYSNIFSDCLDMYAYENSKYTYVEYFNDINKHLQKERFDSEEINTANIILNYPKYTISHNFPILKAESDIGRCYILGFQSSRSK